MILGASTLGQFTLGGTGYAPAIEIPYVDIAADITITSLVSGSIGISGYVDLGASIIILSSITANIHSASGSPDAGVSFTISDQAGGV